MGVDAYIDSIYRKAYEFKTNKYIVLAEVLLKHNQKRTLIFSSSGHNVRIVGTDDYYYVSDFDKVLPNIHISPKVTDEDIEKLLVLA